VTWPMVADTYKWRVIASNPTGATTSLTWSFTVKPSNVVTRPEPSESPEAPVTSPSPTTPMTPIVMTSSGDKLKSSLLPWILGGVGAVLIGGTAYVIIRKKRMLTPKQAVRQLAGKQAQLTTRSPFPPGARKIF